jgi:tetratricopeptide (TPR) repeat protein
VLYQVADLHALLGNDDQSVEWFVQLIGRVPNDAGVLRRLGELCDQMGDRTQAFHYFYDSFRNYPNNVDVIEWLGTYYVEAHYLEKVGGVEWHVYRAPGHYFAWADVTSLLLNQSGNSALNFS